MQHIVRLQILLRSPSMRREWIEIHASTQIIVSARWSPSMRREWIEISKLSANLLDSTVSLHAEGVD